MKKVLMMTAALCTWGTLAQAACSPFNGWAIGVHGGWNQDRVDLDFPGTILDKKLRFNTGFAGLHLDWTTSKTNGFLFGIGFNLGHGFGSSTDTLVDGTNVDAANNTNYTGKIEVELKKKFYGELSTRLGWNFDNKWALYGILAAKAQSSKITTKADSNGTLYGRTVTAGTQRTDSAVLLSFAPGVGVDFKVTDRWTVGGQYKYYIEASAAKAALGGADTKAKISAHNLLVRVSYHF